MGREIKRTMIASLLIEKAGEMKHKRPTKLGFEELVDVVKEVLEGLYTPLSNNYYDTEVIVDGKKYRIGFDSVYLSLQNNRTTGWVLWNNYPPDPVLIGSEFDNEEFKIYMKDVLIYSNCD